MSDDRRERYAAALCKSDGNDWAEIKARYPCDVAEYYRLADAAMAVADEELQRAGGWLAIARTRAKESQGETARLRAELEETYEENQRLTIMLAQHCATIERVRAVLDEWYGTSDASAFSSAIREALEETA